MQNKIRVLLVEHQTLTRIGIKTILSAQTDIEIVGEAGNGTAGFELFKQTKPDVVILSLRLPDSCAIDDLSNYFTENKNAKIIVLAEHAGDAEISKSLKKGALGYVCKDVSENDLVKAIHVVNSGGKYIPQQIADILTENFGQEDLTPSEQKILAFITKGQSNKEVAFELKISENTVKTHVKNIFDKLNVSDRTSAAASAIKRGLVRVDL
jgi:DNA-binding NarL/FixJ family response regulator